MLVGVFAAGIVFIFTAPYYGEDYSDCFSGDVSSLLSKLFYIENWHMLVFGSLLIMAVPLLLFTTFQVKYILKTVKEKTCMKDNP